MKTFLNIVLCISIIWHYIYWYSTNFNLLNMILLMTFLRVTSYIPALEFFVGVFVQKKVLQKLFIIWPNPVARSKYLINNFHRIYSYHGSIFLVSGSCICNRLTSEHCDIKCDTRLCWKVSDKSLWNLYPGLACFACVLFCFRPMTGMNF